MGKRKVLAVCLAAALVACGTTQKADLALKSKWIGRQADEFFTERGPPQSVFQLDNGGKIYTWSSGASEFTLPGGAHTTATTYRGATFATTTYNPPTNVKIECQVQIVVGEKAAIKEIRASRDTIGLWNLSRCAEIFE